MAKIVWYGNKDWDLINDGNQPWDEEIRNKKIPSYAKLLHRPDDFVKASTIYMILPIVICTIAVYFKMSLSQDRIVDLRFMPLAFIIGFIVAMPLHELMHAICFPKNSTVYIGVSIKQLRAFACSAAAMSRERFIIMSLAPMLLGLIFMVIFLLCPLSMKWLTTVSLVSMYMGLISPYPDYMDVLLLLRKVPKGSIIQPTEDGLVWF